MKEDQNNTLGKYDSSQLQLFESATAKKDGDPLKSNSIHFSFVRMAKKHLSLISLYQVSLEATAKGALFVDFPEVQDE